MRVIRNIALLLVPLVFGISCTLKEKKTVNAEEKLSVTEATYTIKNNFLSIKTTALGAELTSIKGDSLEYLWQGNPKFWKHQSPVLFPIVGRLVDHEYEFNNKTYAMNFHGFAWKNIFKVIEKTTTSITYELTSTTLLKEQYPFDFVLQIAYSLKGKNLNVNYFVKNPSKTHQLYFSIGGHPAFNCPMEPNQQRNEYALVFDKKLAPVSQDKINGLRVDKTTQTFEVKGILKLGVSLFNEGALILNPNPFTKATLTHLPTNTPYLSVSFEGFPYLGIWSNKNAGKKITPFVCIEPWYGIADRFDHNKDLTLKEGVLELAPNHTFGCSYTIEIN